MWYDLALFLLSTTGLSWGFTQSSLLRPFREWVSEKNQIANSIERKNLLIWYTRELLGCMFCTAIWTGILVYLAIYQFDIPWTCYPFAGAIVAQIVYKFIRN